MLPINEGGKGTSQQQSFFATSLFVEQVHKAQGISVCRGGQGVRKSPNFV